jgi:GNAT superfamily N-acetyltransferase
VHRLLVEERENGRAYVASSGSVTPVTVVATKSRSTAAHAAIETAAVAMSVAFRPLVEVFVDPGASRIVGGVVLHDVFLSIRTLSCVRDISATYHNPSSIPGALDGVVDLRPATAVDVDACLAAQRRSAVVGYAHIFPQQEYPFPDDVVRQEWLDRFAADVPVIVALVDGEVVGTVSVRGSRLESLFVVPEQWGTGVARALHDAALGQVAAEDVPYAELDVMTANARARRFYEKLGWAPDGRTDVSPYPPFPALTGYRLALT